MDAPVRFLTRLGRGLTVFRRRNPTIRHWVPHGLTRHLVALKSRLTELRPLFIPTRHRARYDNVFHCCVQKTGSQWIKSMLTDLRAYQYSGYTHFHYQSRVLKRGDGRKATERFIERPFPKRAFVSPLYVSYEVYERIPKTGPHRAFFVTRDPRDLVVSWYFSAKKNHILKEDPTLPLYQAREALNRLPQEEGLIYAVDYLRDQGRFDALASWADRGPEDETVLLVPFEDLAAEDNFGAFRRLFDFLDVRIPDAALRDLIAAYSFERLTGRARGTERTDSHLRSGTAGDWKRYFTDAVADHFEAVAGDLPERLGYEPTPARVG